MPSYVITNEVHRQRDEIVGLGSGLSVAGKVRLQALRSSRWVDANSRQELVLGLYEAFSSLVKHPYMGAKTEGPLGFPKGIPRGMGAFMCHLMAGTQLSILSILSLSLRTSTVLFQHSSINESQG